MKKQSAGILLYRRTGSGIEVFLGHAGGPFWSKKDKGAWSIPKGEFEDDEEPQAAARREFQEETGHRVPDGELLELGLMKRPDGKVIYIWAVEGDMDPSAIASNTFELEWPPKSGQLQQFPEIDRAGWFALAKAGLKMHKGQSVFLERLAEKLAIPIDAAPQQIVSSEPTQTTLL